MPIISHPKDRTITEGSADVASQPQLLKALEEFNERVKTTKQRILYSRIEFVGKVVRWKIIVEGA